MNDLALQVIMLYSKGVPVSVIAKELNISMQDVQRFILSFFDYRKIDKKRSFLELWYASRSLLVEHYNRLSKNFDMSTLYEIYDILAYLAKRLLFLPISFQKYPKLIDEETADRALSYYAKVRNYEIAAGMLGVDTKEFVKFLNFAFLQKEVDRLTYYSYWRNMVDGFLQKIILLKSDEKNPKVVGDLLNLERRAVELLDRVAKEFAVERVNLVDFFGSEQIGKLIDKLAPVVEQIEFVGDQYRLITSSSSLVKEVIKEFPGLRIVNCFEDNGKWIVVIEPVYGDDEKYVEVLRDVVSVLGSVEKIEVSSKNLLESGTILNGNMKVKVRFWLKNIDENALGRAELLLKSRKVDYTLRQVDEFLILELL